MKNIKTFDKFLKENYSNEEIMIINDILSTNEGLRDWFTKFLHYGKKGLLTASIILSIAFSAQAQNSNKTEDVIKQGTELATNDVKKDVYSFMVGIATESSSIAMKNGDVEAAGACKEISKHYQNLRNCESTTELSNNAKKYMQKLDNIRQKLDDNTIKYFIEVGKTIKTIN